MTQEFQAILNALDYENQPFTSNLHQITFVNGKIYIGNSGQYLIDRNHVFQVMEYCKQYLEHADDNFTEQYNKALYKRRISERAKREKESAKRRKEQSKSTYIYVMLNARNGLYKIGRSNNPVVRENTLQSQEPEVSLLFQFIGTSETERNLHQKFYDKRVRGEWFRLEQSDIENIKAVYDDQPF
jgi:hypothetical protein